MNDDATLTSLSSTPGGPLTLSPDALTQVLSPDTDASDDRLLSGASDAVAVYRLQDGLALVQAVSLLTPVVDDPAVFGAIAAAHATGPVFATGAEVTLATSIGGAPALLPASELHAMVEGARGKLSEAGATLAGGQMAPESFTRFGLAAVGTAHPSRLFDKASARAGDVVVLTKGLGTGILLAAERRGALKPEHLEAAVTSMLRLNQEAAVIARDSGAHAVTAVGGFGLVGAALVISDACGAQVAIRAGDLPLLPGALGYAGLSLQIPALDRNLDELSPRAEIEEELPGAILRLVFDPQTSGGLLFTLPVADAATTLQRLRETGHQANVIGSVLPGTGVAIDP